ncbi:unnamed protein product [Ceratitis capitata]|uniref:(Mediterranean fruit fly) hypothetical protein n=1 Tax=Ceratitis capitata TaxID=7213 RepID=A0A811U7G8_CERCA|nr:unnamed protein product [Ceratitis capitata]
MRYEYEQQTPQEACKVRIKQKLHDVTTSSWQLVRVVPPVLMLVACCMRCITINRHYGTYVARFIFCCCIFLFFMWHAFHSTNAVLVVIPPVV